MSKYLKLSDYEVQLLIPVVVSSLNNIRNHAYYYIDHVDVLDISPRDLTDSDILKILIDNHDPASVDYSRLMDLLFDFKIFVNK